jgi:hypothetical protein
MWLISPPSLAEICSLSLLLPGLWTLLFTPQGALYLFDIKEALKFGRGGGVAAIFEQGKEKVLG